MRTISTLGIFFFLLFSGIALAQEQQSQQSQQEQTQATTPAVTPAAPHKFVFTPEEKALKNPIKFTAVSVNKGKGLYTTQCAMCHGAAGNGKGDLAGVMHVTPPDFTKPATLAKRTDGELFTIINAGSPSMPGEAKRLKGNQVWNIVNFLRSLQGQTPKKSAGTKTGASLH